MNRPKSREGVNEMIPVEDEIDQLMVLFEIERDYKANQIRYTDKELLEIFREAKTILPGKIKEWKLSRQILVKKITASLTEFKEQYPDNYRLYRELAKFGEIKELATIDNHIARLKRLMFVSKGKIIKGHITQEQIDQALNTPLANIYEGKLRRSGNKLFGICPFHQEKHASFCIYTQNNTWHCFGCGQGGNTINYIRLLRGYSFVEAVKYLIGEI